MQVRKERFQMREHYWVSCLTIPPIDNKHRFGDHLQPSQVVKLDLQER